MGAGIHNPGKPATKLQESEQSQVFAEATGPFGVDEADRSLELAITRMARRQRPAALKRPRRKNAKI